VRVGRYCSIGPGVTIVAGGVHPPDWVATWPFRAKLSLQGAFEDGMPSSRGPVDIGSDVWIGTQAMILSGVVIGHGAIIAARAVVTRPVPPYAIVAGNPARVVRMRFDADIVQRLLASRWWEREPAELLPFVPLLSSTRVVEFLAALPPRGDSAGPVLPACR
jgi:virginiamycin A acetyltransferase